MPDLPLVIGPGANVQEPAWQTLMAAAPALKPRIKAATWVGNRFNLLIKDHGANGNTIYNFGKGYGGVYDPNPHVAFIGGPGGRAGADSGTVPGIIVRQVWLSSRPRPSFANK